MPKSGMAMGNSWSVLVVCDSISFVELLSVWASISTVSWVVRGVAWNDGMDAAGKARMANNSMAGAFSR